MHSNPFLKAGLSAALILALVGCDEAATGSDTGFRKQYVQARTALEEGRYAQASRAYLRLMPEAGPLAARLQLEYAHALLRGGELDKAAAQARALASASSGKDRAAALSVQGTADHELGLAALERGEAGAARNHLLSAQTALGEVLEKAPDLDPLGALAGRLASLRVRLKALG